MTTNDEIVSHIKNALFFLEDLGSAQAIAEYLESIEIKGDPGDAESCPIASYLNELPLSGNWERIEVLPNNRTEGMVEIWNWTNAELTICGLVSLGPNCNSFVLTFDKFLDTEAGEPTWPNLVEGWDVEEYQQ